MKKVLMSGTGKGIFMERVIRDYDAMISKHLHNEYEIYYLLEGEMYYFINDQTYLVKRGCLVFLDRNLIHKTSPVVKYHERILLEIRGEEVIPLMEALGIDFPKFFRDYSGVLELSRDEQKSVEEILFSMADEMIEKQQNYDAIASMKLARLLIFIMRQRHKNALNVKAETANTTKHQKVHEVVEYIVDHCAEQITLDMVADRFFVSKSYLSRIFKEVTGFTVNEFINVQKIKQAQMILTETELPIAVVAKKMGFESLTYFEKVFRRYSEISPLKYRKHQKRFVMQARERANDQELEEKECLII